MNTRYAPQATRRATVMSRQTRYGTRQAGGFAHLAMVCGLLLAGASVAFADDHADARFRGTGKADPIRIENVRRANASVAGQSSITFDLVWDHSWRGAWEVGEQQHGGKGTLKLENWDAAWVFVKFRQAGAKVWLHAALSANKADHAVPAGAALDVGLSDDGKRGIGVFVYREAAGHGPNDWRDVTLRLLHGADGEDDPGAAEAKIFAIEMVRVPQCAFWAGDGSTNRVAGQFSSGYSANPLRIESEGALTLGGEGAGILNNREAVGMRHIDDFSCDEPRPLSARFPKGFAAFYCMRHEITQRQYVDFLNTLSYRQQDACTASKPSDAVGEPALGSARNGIRIAVSGIPDSVEPQVIQRGSFVASRDIAKAGAPATYRTDLPYVACNGIHPHDCAAFAAWAGLRPITELEFEKACRGPLKPVPNEYAWGTDKIAGMGTENGKYTLVNPGKPDETVTWTGDNGPDATHGNAPTLKTIGRIGGPLRVGIFATPDSDRVRAGASYWGIMDLTGNLLERTVTVGDAAGRACQGNHGDGGGSPWKGLFLGMRGGCYVGGSHAGIWARDEAFRASDRHSAVQPNLHRRKPRFPGLGFRCVRTAPAAVGN